MDDIVKNDKQTIIFAACDEMIREAKPVDKITSREVATRVEWSHTVVAPYLKTTRQKRARSCSANTDE